LRNEFVWSSGKDKDVIIFLKQNFQDFFDITAAAEEIKKKLKPRSLQKVEDEVQGETYYFRHDIIDSTVTLSILLKEKPVPVPGDCKTQLPLKCLSFFYKGIMRLLYGTKTGNKSNMIKYEELSTIDDEKKT